MTPSSDIIAPLQFSREPRGIEAFNTTRGQVMPGDKYSGFNVCDYTGDRPAHPVECRMELCMRLGILPEHLVMPQQTHTSNVAEVTSELLALPYSERMLKLENIDALVTVLHHVCIGVNTADCVNVALADPAAGVIGIAHAGWRGTVAHIAMRTVEAMRRIGAEPERMFAVMGASICQNCFEVGNEVVDAFAQADFPISQIVKRSPVTGKAHIALQLANAIVLRNSGVPERNITIADRCPHCSPTLYFSARLLGITSGRTFTGILQR